MRIASARCLAALALALLAAPAAAQAQPSWTCSAGAGWVASGGQRADAPAAGGRPCPTTQAAPGPVSGASGNLSATGSLVTDGGAATQTIDTRTPSARIEAKSLAIQSPDGRLVLSTTDLSVRAAGACDANRAAVFTSDGAPGHVVLNGRAIDSSRDYSEPGLGVNGAPLFGQIAIRFNEVVRTETGLTRRAIHLTVTDSNRAVLFEAVAGEVAIGRDGLVCDPPPLCAPSQQPQAGRCVGVDVTPLPQPPAPVSPPAGVPGAPPQPHAGPRACAHADAVARQVRPARLAGAVLCLMNAERTRHGLRPLRFDAALTRAALRHARDMVARRFFSHTGSNGTQILDRILRSGYLRRYGRWRVGENLGLGWGTGASPRAIVAAWMRSRPHRRNVLNRTFRDVGIAVLIGSPIQRRRGSITYVIDFGGFQATRARG